MKASWWSRFFSLAVFPIHIWDPDSGFYRPRKWSAPNEHRKYDTFVWKTRFSHFDEKSLQHHTVARGSCSCRLSWVKSVLLRTFSYTIRNILIGWKDVLLLYKLTHFPGKSFEKCSCHIHHSLDLNNKRGCLNSQEIIYDGENLSLTYSAMAKLYFFTRRRSATERNAHQNMPKYM